MDHNKKPVGATGHNHGYSSSSSSSSPSLTTHNLDHLFGPKDSSTSVSSSYFGSIFPSPPSTGPGRERSSGNSDGNNSNSNTTSGGNNMDRPCYFNSSIHYGGQENYNILKNGCTFESSSHQPHRHTPKKDGGNDDSNGTNSNGASRGNWWQGSLYY